MAEGVRAGLRLLAALACVAPFALGGCAGGGGHGRGKADRLSEQDLLLMLTILPGRYDNSAQAEADAHSNAHPVHEAVVLIVTHVFTPRLGHYVYYAQESAAADPRRILAQKMWSFELTEKHVIQETLYELSEPARWRDGYLDKDLFTSVQMEDVQLEPCRLVWTKKGDGFVAAHDPKFCPAGGAEAAPELELTTGALSIADYKFVRKGR
ncbi:MAG TPA: CpcT/CpeT family chromophore lyase [Steroidobacteraceae bacterium]|nr:CpcT/CpeT family chromophore lyase [Steroidobacteraceae bacterium]